MIKAVFTFKQDKRTLVYINLRGVILVRVIVGTVKIKVIEYENRFIGKIGSRKAVTDIVSVGNLLAGLIYLYRTAVT